MILFICDVVLIYFFISYVESNKRHKDAPNLVIKSTLIAD